MDISKGCCALALWAVAGLGLVGCGSQDQRAQEAPATGAQSPTQAQGLIPGLGEMMLVVQQRHHKLWLAIDANHWELAEYQAHELGEALERVLRLHQTHDGKPMRPEYIMPQFANTSAAIVAKNKPKATETFKLLTAGCNNCHAATGHAYNKIVAPTGNPFTNQDFNP